MRLILSVAALSGALFAAGAAGAVTVTNLDPTLGALDAGVLAPGDDLRNNTAQFDSTSRNPIAADKPKTKKNESQTTLKLFTLYTDETSLQGDDLNQTPIDLTFDFTLPTPNDGTQPITGDTSGQFQLLGFVQQGVLTWTDSTVDLYYGSDSLPQADKGLLTISVNGGTFNQGFFGLDDGKKDGLTVSATFDWVRDPSAVPEPASWALMIGGFGLAGVTLRRRRTAVAAA